MGDPVLLERLAENLIENAVRYNAAVGWVRVRTGIERGEAVLHVANPGARIDPGAVEELLEPFRRLESSRARSTGGYGLGLAVVRAVAQAHGGRVAVLARREGGLEVTVSLPMASARPPASRSSARPRAAGVTRSVAAASITPAFTHGGFTAPQAGFGVSRPLRRDQVHVRRLLPLLVAAGISAGRRRLRQRLRLQQRRSSDAEVQRRQRRVQRRAARRGQEGRSSHRAGRGRRGLRRPGPDLLRLRLHDPLRGQPRRCTPTARATTRSRAPDIADGEPQISSRPEDDHGQAQEGHQVRAAGQPRDHLQGHQVRLRARVQRARALAATPRSTSPTSSARRASPATIKDIPGIETPDDSTIVFKLKGPSAALVSQALAMPISTPVPQEYAKQVRRQDAVDLRPVRRLHRPVHVQERQPRASSSGARRARASSWCATPTGTPRPTTARPTWTRSRSRRATTTRSPRRGASSRARRLVQGDGTTPAPVIKQALIAQQGPDRVHPRRRLPLRSR